MSLLRVGCLSFCRCLTFTFVTLSSSFLQADVDAQIRSFLEGVDAGDAAQISGRKLEHVDILATLYRVRKNQPIWLDGGPLSKQAEAVLTSISESVGHGFAPERYHRSMIEQLLHSQDGGMALELLLTDAFLGQALHRARGTVSPANLDAEWQVPPAEVDAGGLLLATAEKRKSVATALTTLWPASDEYGRLLQRRSEITASGDVQTTQIASGVLLKPGQVNDRVVMLKQRLLGPADHSPNFDDNLRREVVAFQSAAGLEPDGMVGDSTIEALNETRVSWIDRIDANLERWRWLPRSAPDTYIRVNIAAYRLRVITNGKTVLGMKVIVGKPFRRTPVFTETIKYFVLNPFWNVPYSIATKDKLPMLQSDAKAQAAKGFQAKPSGSDVFVAVDAIDWRNVKRTNFNYLLRQQPGTDNALGRVKFMLPNPYAIYLHDTPNHALFSKQERSFSSGCVRLEKPLELADWLIRHDGQHRTTDINSLLASRDTHTVYLKKPLPTYIVYFTAFVDDDDQVVFRRDIYGRDKAVVAALRDPI